VQQRLDPPQTGGAPWIGRVLPLHDINRMISLNKKNIAILLCFMAALTSCVHNPQMEMEAPDVPQSKDSIIYDEKVKYLKGASEDEIRKFDFYEFRHSYFMAQRGGSVSPELRNRFDQAIKDHNPEQIIKTSDLILQKDFTDIRAHVMKAQSDHILGLYKEERFHRMMAVGLHQSIVNSGDGKTTRTAWKVFQIKEEYDTLRLQGFFRVLGQSVLVEGNKFYDKLIATNENNDEATFYFDVTDMINNVEQLLAPKQD